MPKPFQTITTNYGAKSVEPIGRLDSLKVYYLGYYRPKGSGLQDEVDTVRILDLKNNDSSGVEYYARKMQAALGTDVRGAKLVAMPSHNAGSAPVARELRKMFQKLDGAVDLSECLVRHTAIDPQHKMKGKRTATRHLESMWAEKVDRLRDLDILLVDDVVTSGSTMKAGWTILKQAGARSVTCLALGMTSRIADLPTRPNPLPTRPNPLPTRPNPPKIRPQVRGGL